MKKSSGLILLSLCISLLLLVSFISASLEDDFFLLMNKERTSLGKQKITINSNLQSIAYAHSKEMSDFNYFSHLSIKNKTVYDRITAGGYKTNYYGENILAHYGKPDMNLAFNAWKNSPGHYALMTSPDYNEAGLGIYYNGLWSYYTLDFGKAVVAPPAPKPTPTPTPVVNTTNITKPTPKPAPTPTPTPTPANNTNKTNITVPKPTPTPAPKPTPVVNTTNTTKPTPAPKINPSSLDLTVIKKQVGKYKSFKISSNLGNLSSVSYKLDGKVRTICNKCRKFSISYRFPENYNPQMEFIVNTNGKIKTKTLDFS